MGSCLTLGNELSEETHELTMQETLLGRGARAESSRARVGTKSKKEGIYVYIGLIHFAVQQARN